MRPYDEPLGGRHLSHTRCDVTTLVLATPIPLENNMITMEILEGGRSISSKIERLL